jgi:hypothetical protein
MRTVIATLLTFALWSLPVWALCQDRVQPLVLYVEVEPNCVDPDLAATFREELRLRMPKVTVVFGEVPAGDDSWRLRWKSSGPGESCEILATWGATSRSLPISSLPDATEVELVASQLAWMISVGPAKPIGTISSDPPPQEKTKFKSVGMEKAPLEEGDSPPKESATDPEDRTLGSGEESSDAEKRTDVQTAHKAEQPGADDAIDDDTGPRATEVGFIFSALPDTDPRKERIVPRLSFNLIAGQHWGLRGFEFGLVANTEVRFVKGAQVAVGFNRVGGDVDGAQIALLANSSGGLTEGAQVTFGINRATRLVGLQWAWGVNHADDVHGLQMAWLANVADRIRGAQLAVAVNFADLVGGLQLGLLNIADRVNGVQLGLANFSNTAAAPIGLVNIMADEPVYTTASIGAGGVLTAGLQHGGRNLRYLYLVAADVVGDQPDGEWGAYGVGLGLSGHLPFEPFYVDLDLIALRIWVDRSSGASHQMSLRGLFGWRVQERLAFFAGPSVNLLFTDRSDGLGIVPFGIETAPTRSGASITLLYPEVHAGVRF